MYSCTITFAFAGVRESVIDSIRAMPPLDCFTHVFMDPDASLEAIAAAADVIIAGPLLDEAALAGLLAAKKPPAGVVLLHERPVAAPLLEQLADAWRLPLSAAELRFHFTRWQRQYKQGKDLWQARQFLEGALDTTPNLVWFKDKSGIHELVNASFCRTVRKTREQVQGQRHAYIWDVEADDPACIESERIVMESGETHVSEEAIDTGDGKRLLTTYKSPLRDVDGSMMGTLGIAIDITQERLYQEKLLQNNAALETIFTTMDCGILCHSLDGSRIISINRAALRLLDFASLDEMESGGFQMVASTVMEEDKPKLRAAIGQLRHVGDSTNYEYRIIHADGKTVHVMGNAKLVEKDGELICQRFLLDCTAQKLREEQEQNEKERRQMELVRALSVDYQLVCVLDADSREGRVLQLVKHPDHTLSRIFSGAQPFAQKVEAYIQTCVHPDDRQAMRQAFAIDTLREELAHRKIFYLNYRALNGDTVQYFQLKAVRAGTLDDPHGIVIGLMNVDARTRHEMEQHARLSEALKRAREASAAKSVFLSNMSHDIRTPMNAVVGYTSLALAHLDRPGQVQEYLRKILASGNHLISLINDILDMSYIESGKIQLEEKPCELPALLRELWNIVRPTADARHQTLTLTAEQIRNEHILCDKLRLNQVFLNLLSNSVKYTAEGGAISMRVTQEDCDRPGHAAYVFRIRDNGMGMSEEFLTRIFEPFERANSSTVAGIQGTGLGMAITRNIVEMMHGDIQVRSTLNVGTEFELRVTFRVADDERDAAENALLADRAVLLVSADAQATRTLAALLRGRGLTADVAESAGAALRLLDGRTAGGSYDLCLIDADLPDGAALSLARHIRQQGGALPRIALVRDSWTEDCKNSQGVPAAGASAHACAHPSGDAGVDSVLGKPLFWSDVRACLLPDAATAAEAGPAQHRAAHAGRILLAEDNAMNQEIATEFLTGAGYAVDVAANGRQAVEMLTAAGPGHYDVILMDVQMPVLDGYGATQAIRALADKRLASVPIIAMTANSFEEDRQEALMRGMNDHIAKPIDFKMLFATLDRLLGQGRG